MPSASPTLYDDDPNAQLSPSNSTSFPTRTVAIIKNHGLIHRFDIEPRIQAASFEIVKERQMEFDTETDPETLYELFGEDAASLAEGPVWVFVLERHRAVEVWNTLMGPRDPEIARIDAPNSLRALYGLSLSQNAVMGSPDNHFAEVQIASLFASSPPFPTTDLPPDDDRYNSIRSDQRRRSHSNEVSSPSTRGSNGVKAGGGKVLFRARPVPVTNILPDIVPRTTRAAQLRAGVVVEKVPSAPRAPLSKEQLAKTFANVPGHKRAETFSVASTQAPAIAPRMTKAASLRLGQQPAPPPRRQTVNAQDVFEGVPGHKRRESISVASSKAPTIAPRLNKSATLRVSKEQAPPTSFMFRSPTERKLPGRGQSDSQNSLESSPRRNAVPRPASQQAMQSNALSRPIPSRSSSALGVKLTPSATRPTASRAAAPSSFRQPNITSTSLTTEPTSSSFTDEDTNAAASPVTPASAVPATIKAKPRPSSIGAPTIAPRTNRSALLRAAKQEAEQAAAAVALAKKNPRTKPIARTAVA